MLNFYHLFFFEIKTLSLTLVKKMKQHQAKNRAIFQCCSCRNLESPTSFSQPLWVLLTPATVGAANPKVGGMIQQLSAIHEEDTHEGGYQLW